LTLHYPVAESLANQLGEHKLSCINFNNNTKRELFARMKKAIGSDYRWVA